MSEVLLDNQILPHNIEAEQAVLATIFYDPAMATEIAAMLKPDDFYRQDHRVLYQTLLKMHDARIPIDLITMMEQLQKDGNLEKVGGMAYVAQVSNSMTIIGNVSEYVRIVREKATLRELISVANSISNMSHDAEVDSEALLDKAESMVLRISQKRAKSDLVHIAEVLDTAVNHIELVGKQTGEMTGVTSGLVDLDRMTNGWQPSDFIILAARPAMGKTALALNMAQSAAIARKEPVAIFSLEMSREQLVYRMLSSGAEIDQQRLRNGNITADEWINLFHALEPLADAPIYLDDTPGISIREIRAKCRRMQSEQGLCMVIIDYLQLMSGGGRAENRQQEVSQISRELKALARELNVPVIALSQLSRSVEAGQEKKPSLSHLRESGSLEQDADLVMFIYRDEYYNPESELKGIAELIIAKHRNGATGSVNVSFRKEFTKFGNLAPQQYQSSM